MSEGAEGVAVGPSMEGQGMEGRGVEGRGKFKDKANGRGQGKGDVKAFAAT